MGQRGGAKRDRSGQNLAGWDKTRRAVFHIIKTQVKVQTGRTCLNMGQLNMTGWERTAQGRREGHWLGQDKLDK